MWKKIGSRLVLVAIQYGSPGQFRNSIQKSLIKNNTAAPMIDEIMNEIKEIQKQIISSDITKQFVEIQHARKNKHPHTWIPLSASFMASYKTLVDMKLFSHGDALELLSQAVCELIPANDQIVADLKKMKATQHDEDHLERVKEFLEDNYDKYPGFDISTQIVKETKDLGEEFLVTKMKVDYCVMNSFFRAHNMIHILPAMCSFDCTWASSFNNPTVGLKFRRNKVLSLNDTCCEFAVSKDFEKDMDDVVFSHIKCRK